MTITNVTKNGAYDVWGARFGKYPHSKHLNNTPPGERGWIGNPYAIGPHGDRENVIALYRADFYERIKDPVFKQAVLELDGERVCCFCAPLPCHLNVVKEYITLHKLGYG